MVEIVGPIFYLYRNIYYAFIHRDTRTRIYSGIVAYLGQGGSNLSQAF